MILAPNVSLHYSEPVRSGGSQPLCTCMYKQPDDCRLCRLDSVASRQPIQRLDRPGALAVLHRLHCYCRHCPRPRHGEFSDMHGKCSSQSEICSYL